MYVILTVLQPNSYGSVCQVSQLRQFKAEFFKALAHPLRIGILEVLAEGERNVNEIQACLNSEGSAVSQQLSVLRSKNIVVGVKQGKHVIYALRDPMIGELLKIARDIFNNHLTDTITTLEELQGEEERTKIT